MADRHDDVDAWLSERIDPLPPPPGTFELVKRRARRRKFRKLAITATSAAAIVAAAVTVPQVVRLPVLSPGPQSSVAAGTGQQSSSATPTRTGSNGETSSAAGSAVPIPAPVPPDFQPSSVTFVGQGTGWVIGQAGTPGHCATQYCTSVARTDDAGRTWAGVFVTHTGGRTWTPVDTRGLRVTDLETVGSRVFALWASCTGSGPAYGSQCASFTLYSAPAAGGSWAPVGAATTGLSGGTGDGAAGQAAALVLTGSRGYLLAPGGALYAGPVDGSAPWQRIGSLVSSCTVGPARANGQPAGALLGAVNANDLIVACMSASGTAGQRKQVFSSPNGGVSWLRMGTAPTAGTAFSLAASPSGSVLLATDQGIDLLPRGEIAWRTATLKGDAPAGGFGFVGMTTDDQGIALPADPSAGTVWFTFDGGRDWQPSRLDGP